MSHHPAAIAYLRFHKRALQAHQEVGCIDKDSGVILSSGSPEISTAFGTSSVIQAETLAKERECQTTRGMAY